MLLLSITTLVHSQDILITGVIDATLTGGTPKAVELYVVNDIADLSTYAIGSANNGGGTDGEEFFLSGSATAGDFIYIASEQPNFNTFFGFDPNFVNGAANVNGDDAIELFNNGVVIDTFGDINTDGSGEDWEYQDGWAYRNSGTTADGAIFTINNWSFSSPNALDGESDNASASTPFPLGTYSTVAPILITFDSELTQAVENDGVANIPVSISESANATVDVSVAYTNDLGTSFILDTTTLTYTTGGPTTQNITITLTDNADENQDYLVAITLQNFVDAEEGEQIDHTLYVTDDELQAPTASNVLGMNFETSFEVNGAEIVTHDITSSRLFVSNSGDNAVEVIDFSDPLNMSVTTSVDMSAFGDEVTSVNAYNGTVAVAVRAADQGNGQIVFIDTDGNVLSNVEVGSLPDMVTFTPDGTKVLVANEGEPSDDYTIDPEGTISVIDITGGVATLTQTEVTSLNFNSFDANQATLEAAGVRIFGPGASVSQDLEPEFITVSDDSTIAYVSLQENNAYAIVDLTAPSITAIEPWGVKDHSMEQNALDASNRLDFIFMSTWNVVGMYQPDAIANYTVDGTNYIITANEGDARDYDGFSEEVRIDDLNLDPEAYPNADILQVDENLGRLRTTNATGDTDNDGDIDLIHVYGSRSFSIVNADTGVIVYDSQDLLERITKEDPVYGAIFNTTDDENSFKNRSDDKGPEPEAVIVQQIGDQWYAFIGLERIGGIAVFNVTDPTAPTFETYVNNRDTTPDVENPSGDLAPEGVIYVSPENNATGNGLIVVANEVSSTISVYSLENDALNPFVSFDEELTQANENDGTVTIPVSIDVSANVTVDVTVAFTNDLDASYTLDTPTLTYTQGGPTTQNVILTLTDNTDGNQDDLISLALENIVGGQEGENTLHNLYVIDDELQAPTATDALGMSFATNIEVNGAEIVTHDINSSRLYVSNAGDNTVEIIDFTDPLNMSVISSIDMSAFGAEVTSVNAFDGVVAVAVRAEDQSNGRVVFIDANGAILSDVEVGSLPDMVTFTPDGTKVVVANEGEPNDDYTIDPEGSIGIIDVSGGAAAITQADVTILDFNAGDGFEDDLNDIGVRIFGPGASTSQDLEPEFITISEDSETAYVSLQENNAYFTIDLTVPEIVEIAPYGLKDHSQEENALDASNRLDFVFMSTWNVVGMYQPDAIANYTVDGTNYLVIANEGDARDYDGYSEEVRIDDLNLDPDAYPNADILQIDENLGRLRTTNATGDFDNDGDIDLIHIYGGRSFSIINTDTDEIVFDSGDLLERITKEDPIYGAIFNTTDDENSFKNRSDDKGPEPEAVIVKLIAEQWYAFIGLERIGGIAVFNVTDPANPVFETYVNNRDTTLDIENPEGDLAPEGVIYIAPENNATETGLIVVANEVSSTISIYMLENDTLSTEEFTAEEDTIKVYPNPASNGNLFFSKESGYEMYDIIGRKVASSPMANQVNIDAMSTGMYIIKFSNGTSQKVIIK